MRVFAVPRSIARSLENMPSRKFSTIRRPPRFAWVVACRSRGRAYAPYQNCCGRARLPAAQVAFETGLLYRPGLRKEIRTVLDSMRKGADSFLVKGFYVVIVLVFVFWGVGTMRANRKEVAALVNNEVITKHQFDRAYQNLQNMYRNMGQGAASPPEALLRSQAIAQLVSNELLIQEAHRLGLEVDEAELRQSIAGMP